LRRKLTYALGALAVIAAGAMLFARLGVAIGGPISVVALTVAQKAAEPGGQIIADLQLNDDDLSVRGVEAVVTSPDGLDRLPVHFRPTGVAGKWEANLMLPPAAIPGRWQIGELKATDDTKAARPLVGGASFEVASDQEAHGFTVDLLSGTFRETQILPVMLKAAELAELERAVVTLVGPKGQITRQTVAFSGPSTEWEIPVRLVKGLGQGAWRIARITLYSRDGAVRHLLDGQDFAGKLQIARGREDSSPPTVTHASVSPARVQTGGTFAVSARVTDDFAGLQAVGAVLVDPSGVERQFFFMEQAPSGEWAATVELPLYVPAGNWQVLVKGADVVGNEPAEPYAIPLTVTAGYAQLPDLTVERITIEGGAGQITIRAQVPQEVPVTGLMAELRGPGAIAPIMLPLEPEGEGSWARSIPLPAHAPSGEWRITGVQLQDTVSRTQELNAAQLPAGVLAVQVASSSPDQAPPVLQSLTVTPAARAGERIRVTLQATDDLAGVGEAWVRLTGPKDHTLTARLQYDPASATWVGTGVIATDAPPGTWTVGAVRLVDLAWNEALLTTGPGMDATVTVRGRQ